VVDWAPLGTIAENIAYAISILGITGLAWWIAYSVVGKLAEKMGSKKKEEK